MTVFSRQPQACNVTSSENVSANSQTDLRGLAYTLLGSSHVTDAVGETYNPRSMRNLLPDVRFQWFSFKSQAATNGFRLDF